MSAITRLGPHGFQTRRTGSFSGKTVSGVRVAEETRKALEGVLSATALTVAWPGRPFTLPASGPWLQPVAVRWDNANPETMGASATRLGRLTGYYVVEVVDWEGGGPGGLYDAADGVRDLFQRVAPSVPSSMRLQCFAPSGPTPAGQDVNERNAVVRLVVRIPFEVFETVPN